MSKLDPALRCDSCQKLERSVVLKKIGCCQHCGNRRFRSITTINEKEEQQLIEWGFTDLAAEFKEVKL